MGLWTLGILPLARVATGGGGFWLVLCQGQSVHGYHPPLMGLPRGGVKLAVAWLLDFGTNTVPVSHVVIPRGGVFLVPWKIGSSGASRPSRPHVGIPRGGVCVVFWKIG